MNENLQHFERYNIGRQKSKHKWITKEIAAALPRIGTTSELPAEQVKVALKLFNPTGIGTWYITEANFETGEAFGYCDLGEPELGYVDLNELRAFVGRFGLPIERDEHFGMPTLAEVMAKTEAA